VDIKSRKLPVGCGRPTYTSCQWVVDGPPKHATGNRPGVTAAPIPERLKGPRLAPTPVRWKSSPSRRSPRSDACARISNCALLIDTSTAQKQRKRRVFVKRRCGFAVCFERGLLLPGRTSGLFGTSERSLMTPSPAESFQLHTYPPCRPLRTDVVCDQCPR
jgi:hypothetical protein